MWPYLMDVCKLWVLWIQMLYILYIARTKEEDYDD